MILAEPNNIIGLSQRQGESILYSIDVSKLLDQKELISSVESGHSIVKSARSRKGKMLEVRIEHANDLGTANFIDCTVNLTFYTNLSNKRIVTLKVRIIR